MGPLCRGTAPATVARRAEQSMPRSCHQACPCDGYAYCPTSPLNASPCADGDGPGAGWPSGHRRARGILRAGGASKQALALRVPPRLCDAAKLSRLCDAQSLQSCVIDAPFIAGVLGSLPSESVIFARLSCDVMSTGSRRIVLGTTGARGKAAGRPPTSMHGAIAARRASSMRSVGHAGGVRPASSGRSG